MSVNDKTALEEGAEFLPAFDPQGLIPAVASDHVTGTLLMVAWMNQQALDETLRTGVAHFWSRSRKKLWRKGEESGNTLRVREMRTDCDQDVLWLRVEMGGNGLACHTNRPTCFYRKLVADGGSVRLDMSPVEGLASGTDR